MADHRLVRVTAADMTEDAVVVTNGRDDVLVVRSGLLPDAVMRWMAGDIDRLDVFKN